MASVSYNGLSLIPVPFVSKVQKSSINGSHTYPITEFKLNGFVTGDVSGQSSGILEAFSGDFKAFSVSGTDILDTGYFCLVRSVNFSPSRSRGVSSYSIDLECYRGSDFVDSGVKEPKNEWEYKEGSDGIVTLNHKISANGIHTGTSAFQAAKGFVTGLMGLANKPSGIFGANSVTGGTYTLVSERHNANHAIAYYSVEETYKMATSGASTGLPLLQTSSCSIDSGIEKDFTVVNLSVNQQMEPSGSDLLLNSILSVADLYNMASGLSQVPNLINEPISFDVAYVPPKINYEISFTDDQLGVTYFDFNQNINFDQVTQIASVSIEGVIKSKGNLNQRAQNVSGYFTSTFGGDGGMEAYLYTLANTFYTAMGGAFSLRNKAVSFSKGDSASFRGDMSINATFDDRDTISSTVDSSFSVQASLPVPILIPRGSILVNGLYKIYDAAINSRQASSIQILSSSSSGVASMKTAVYSLANQLITSYVPATERVLKEERLDLTTGTVNQLTLTNQYTSVGPTLLVAAPPII